MTVSGNVGHFGTKVAQIKIWFAKNRMSSLGLVGYGNQIQKQIPNLFK